MIKYIAICFAITILLMVVSCNTIGKLFNADDVTAKAEETKVELTSEEEADLLDRVLSTPILIVYALASLACFGFAIFAFKGGNVAMGIACGCGGIVVALLPVIIAVFFKALIILLYVFICFIIVVLGLAVWFIFRKVDNHLDKEELEELNR